MSLVAPTDTGRDIARAAQSLFAREDMPIGGVRLFGVRVEGLQSRAGGVAVTLDRDERPQPPNVRWIRFRPSSVRVLWLPQLFSARHCPAGAPRA